MLYVNYISIKRGIKARLECAKGKMGGKKAETSSRDKNCFIVKRSEKMAQQLKGVRDRGRENYRSKSLYYTFTCC